MARRQRLARAGGPRAGTSSQQACSLESSSPSLFVRAFVPYVARPVVGPSWGTNCARSPPLRRWRRAYRGH